MRRSALSALLAVIIAGAGSILAQEPLPDGPQPVAPLPDQPQPPAPLPDRLQPAAWLQDDLATRLRQRMHLTRSEPAFRSGVGDSGPARPVQRGPAGLGSELSTGSPALTFVVLVVLCALIFAAVVVYLLRSSTRPDPPPSKPRRPRRDHMKDGDAALADGDCERALRAFYRHGVQALITSGVIPTAEHLSDALISHRLEDQLRSPFAHLSHQFQPMRYGARKVSEAVARNARAAAIDLARVAFRIEPESDHGPA